ncbi:MAG: NosD domain-containing protein, partial [Candidatus Korarchaeota archaeon]|nr:NosD domain-containing protein [Candidatus Korarchaeota archaeon]
GWGSPEDVRVEAFNTTQNVIELSNVRNVTVENITVLGAGSQMAGVHVEYSSESIVRNIIATGNHFGVYVVSSSNITLRRIKANNNTEVGIYLSGSTISSVSESEAEGNNVGLLSLFVTETSVENVSAMGNSYGGVILKYSSNNTFLNITTNNNSWYGIFLENSDDNVFSVVEARNNTAHGDGHGIYIYVGSDNNSILNANVIDNFYGVSFVSNSNGNVLKNSKVDSNTIAGVYIEESSNNEVNAEISGSIYGIWVLDSDENELRGEVSKCRWGILISGLSGSSGNVINGTLIHDNSYTGIVVEGNSSRGNIVTSISSYNNTLLGIDLGGDFVTPNDGSLSAGPNDLVDYPVLSWAAVYGSRLIVRGYINVEGSDSANSNFDGATVEIYQSDGDPSGYGEGLRYLGTLMAENGEFMGWIDLPPELASKSINLTALTTLLPHGTSEFGPVYEAPAVATNLTISKSINPSTVTPNSTAEVLLLIRNYGNGTAYNVTVTDVLPEGMEYINGTARVDGDMVEPEIEGRNLSWLLDVPADSEVIIRFNISIDAPAGTTLENLAVFYGDYGKGNDTDEVDVINPAIIEVTKEAQPDLVDVNETVNYTVILTNSGGMSALLMVEDLLPSGMNYVNGSFSSNLTMDGPVIEGRHLKYNITLNPGQAARVTYSLLATTYGTRENKVYVNDSFMASASVLVRDPPPPPPPDSGGNIGGSTRRRTPPPCGWIPPNNDVEDQAPQSNGEETHNYRLTSPPIVFVSLGSQGISYSYRGQGSSETGSGSSGNTPTSQSGSENGVSGVAGVTSPPLVVVELMATPTSAETGTPITFVARVSNIGDGPSKDLSLTVDLTSGLDYVKGTSMVGGLRREPDNENNRLTWEIGALDPSKAVEVSFRAELLATSGSFNVVARADSSSDSVLISVKPKSKPAPPKPPAPPPEVVDLRASASNSGGNSRIRVTVSSPTGARSVKILVNLDPSLRYVQGSSRIGGMASPPKLSGNVLEWQVSISKGGTATVMFEVSPADEESTGGSVLVSLPKYGKSVKVEVKFSPAQRGVAPPPTFSIELPSLSSIPWWVILIPFALIPFLLAVRRRERVKRIVMDYEALKWAVRRGVLDDLVQDHEILIPMETFNKLSKDQALMSSIEKLIVDRAIKVEKAPKRKIVVKGADEELSAALGLADREDIPIYTGREGLLKELKRRGFDARLIREAPPPALKRELP